VGADDGDAAAIALSLTFSALAATLVGVAEYHTDAQRRAAAHAKMAALGFEIMLGSITVGGTIVAAGKLQEWITSKPVTYQGQNFVNGWFSSAVLGLRVTIVDPTQEWAFYVMIGASLVFGVMLVMPIGGADMPVVVALLNSYSGLAVVRDGLRARQRHPHHQRLARRRVGIHPLDLDEQGDEPLVHERVVRGVRQRDDSGAGKSAAGLAVRSIGVEDAAIQLA
jgi:NAD(P) transhydrogenase subunit beta